MAQTAQGHTHKFINQIGAGETVNDIYVVREPILRSTSRGDLYIAMFLCDRTGQLNGRMWQASEVVYKSLPKPGFVHLQGRSELYQNNLQIVVNTIAAIDPSKVNVENYLARTTKDCAQMFKEVQEIVGTIRHPQLAALCQAFLTDPELMKSFCSAPGGMKMHHDCIGGLLEHTHSMLRVARSILPLYPQIQADLVLAGVFLHDMGKTEELSYDMAFSYTDSGQLIGHISKSLLMIHRKAEALRAAGTKIDPEILDSIGFTIRERVRIQGEVRVLTAQGMLSGYVISFLPIALMAILFLINREYIGAMFKEPCGWAMLALMAIMITIGFISIQKIVRIDV